MLWGLALACLVGVTATLPSARGSAHGTAWPHDTFGTAIKEQHLGGIGKETLLFSRENGPGLLQNIWFTGSWLGYEYTRFRIYVDGEAEPSIDYELFMGHGIGFGDPTAPWGTKRFGKNAIGGGVFNTYRIPFSKSIRITAEPTSDVVGPLVFWFYCRGITNAQVQLGDLQLPSSARLKLYKNTGTFNPLEFVTLANVTSPGALLQFTLSASSSNWNFLEAMVRVFANGAKEPLLLSSGTEDYFNSAFYFDVGRFWQPLSGVTHFTEVENPFFHSVSAYRFHEEDTVTWSKVCCRGIIIPLRFGHLTLLSMSFCRMLFCSGVLASASTAKLLDPPRKRESPTAWLTGRPRDWICLLTRLPQ
jgi:D-arabinan exo alpha-(1,3)/(1,5)-arabinofuranosidase (non-reducing end)